MDNDKNVLYTVVHGSKLYGTDGPNSDTDYKTVYLPPLSQLLRGKNVKNAVMSTGGKGKNTSVDEDHEYIPLQILAEDFMKGQSYAVEIVFSAIDETQFTKDKRLYETDEFKEFCRELSSNFLTSNITSMIGYAQSQARRYGIRGTRLNDLRALQSAMLDVLDRTPEDDVEALKMREMESYLEQNTTKYVYRGQYKLSDVMNEDCGYVLEKVFPFSISLLEALDRVDGMLKKFGNRSIAAAKDGADVKAISHAIRIINQALQVLRDHKIDFPCHSNDILRGIKDGTTGMSPEQIENMMAVGLDHVERWKEKTTLRAADDVMKDEFNEWLNHWLLSYYNIEAYDKV